MMLIVVKVKGPLGDKDEIGIVFVVHCSYIFKNRLCSLRVPDIHP
jgi:hypothetical protein